MIVLKIIGAWVLSGLFGQMGIRIYNWEDPFRDYSAWFWSAILGPLVLVVLLAGITMDIDQWIENKERNHEEG